MNFVQNKITTSLNTINGCKSFAFTAPNWVLKAVKALTNEGYLPPGTESDPLRMQRVQRNRSDLQDLYFKRFVASAARPQDGALYITPKIVYFDEAMVKLTDLVTINRDGTVTFNPDQLAALAVERARREQAGEKPACALVDGGGRDLNEDEFVKNHPSCENDVLEAPVMWQVIVGPRTAAPDFFTLYNSPDYNKNFNGNDKAYMLNKLLTDQGFCFEAGVLATATGVVVNQYLLNLGITIYQMGDPRAKGRVDLQGGCFPASLAVNTGSHFPHPNGQRKMQVLEKLGYEPTREGAVEAASDIVKYVLKPLIEHFKKKRFNPLVPDQNGLESSKGPVYRTVAKLIGKALTLAAKNGVPAITALKVVAVTLRKHFGLKNNHKYFLARVYNAQTNKWETYGSPADRAGDTAISRAFEDMVEDMKKDLEMFYETKNKRRQRRFFKEKHNEV